MRPSMRTQLCSAGMHATLTISCSSTHPFVACFGSGERWPEVAARQLTRRLSMAHLGKRIPLPLEPLPCPTSASHRAFFSVHCSVQICPPPPNQPRWCDPPLRTAVLRPLRPANVCVHPCGSLDLSEKVCCVLQALHGGWIRWSAAAALRRSGAIGPQDCGQVFRRSFWLQAAIACILAGCVCLQQFDAQVYARRCPVSAPARPPRQPTVTALCGLYVVCEGPIFCCRSVVTCLTTVLACLQDIPTHNMPARAVDVIHFP